MLFLVFRLGNDRYAIETTQVIEVLPLVYSKLIPRAPAGIAGIFNYHGAPVPLIDLAALALQKSSRKWMSTRIILINHRTDSGETHMLGLLAEQVTETLRRTEEDFEELGITAANSPYLGPVTTDGAGIIQRIEVAKLLSETVRGQLYQEQVDAE
jgi:chemotaxis-related protein WspB